MHKRISTLILALLTYSAGFSQPLSNIFIYDKEYGIPVEDANIKLRNGVVLSSDRTGRFEFPLSYPDTVIVSHISYMPHTTIVDLNTDTIFLNSSFYEIKSVNISPNRQKRIGKNTRKEKHYGILYAYGHQIAQKFKLSKSPARLLDLKFHIFEMGGADSLLIKSDFFNITDGFPGKKNIRQQILFVVKQKDDISIDLSPYYIEMNDDFILSLQIMKVYAKKTVSDELPYIKIPIKIDMVGQTYMRSRQSGWNKKKGASLGISILTSY
jgi:hypothetical protein